MSKVKVKANAKLNLTIDVLARNGDFHDISSLVAEISLGDEITVKPRKDDKIILKRKGIIPPCEVEKDNAFKTAVAFSEKFDTCGVDITINKKIPIGAGLGGSSADIAGVLNALKTLFCVDGGISDISSKLASDATYMLDGGYAVISGRGNQVEKLSVEKSLSLLLITNEKSVSAGACYKKFDELNVRVDGCTKTACEKLIAGDLRGVCSVIKNDLYLATKTFIPELESDIEALKSAGATTALMTGSGSAVFGIFSDDKARDNAFKTLKGKYKNRLIKAKTIVK